MTQTEQPSTFNRLARSLFLAHSPESVWNSLTESSKLNSWLCAGSEIDLRVDGAYRFWGPQVMHTPAPGDAHQRITALEPKSVLSFNWPIKGYDNFWKWRLAPDGAGTRLTAEVDRQVDANEDVQCSLDTVEVVMFALRVFLDEGKLGEQPDYARDALTPKVQITIQAPADDVFAALTEPAKLDQWIGHGAEVDLKVGGTYRYGWTEGEGEAAVPAGPREILAFEESRLLRTDWHYSNAPETVVEWVLEAQGGTTTVKLTHTGFLNPASAEGYTQGWLSFLYRIKAVVEAKPLIEKVG